MTAIAWAILVYTVVTNPDVKLKNEIFMIVNFSILLMLVLTIKEIIK